MKNTVGTEDQKEERICRSAGSEEELEAVRESALKILNHADNTKSELVRKLLKKGYPEELIEAVADSLSDADLLNDVRYAEQYTRIKTEAGKGPLWIRKKLSEKGLDRDLIDGALAGVSEQQRERGNCLARALELCGLKYDFEIDERGDVYPREGSEYEYQKVRFFETDGETETGAEIRCRELSRIKAGIARKLSASGFSADAVINAVHRIENL